MGKVSHPFPVPPGILGVVIWENLELSECSNLAYQIQKQTKSGISHSKIDANIQEKQLPKRIGVSKEWQDLGITVTKSLAARIAMTAFPAVMALVKST